ncbi:MAG: hypothetical protein ACK6A9_20775 [Dolichospermum sp.]|jgi:hypothetical protein|nr:hypothetical protein [Anabaena sp. 49628_E55]
MSAKESDLKNQAKVILDALALLDEGMAFTPFEQCQSLNRKRESLVFWIQKLWVLQIANQGEDNKNYDL